MTDTLTAYERWELPLVEDGVDGNAQEQRQRSPLTASQVEDVQRRAHNEAFEQGRADGYAQGLEEARAAVSAEMSSAAESLREGLNCLSRPFEALDAEIEQSLVALACATARALFNDELRAEPERVLTIVRHALASLPSSEREVVLELHPEDAAIVREALNAEGATWELRENPGLTRGGCVIESSASRIDASVEARLESVIAHVLGRGNDPARDESHVEEGVNP